MKTMTCRDLGGACDLELRADSFEAMARLSQAHGQEMVQRGDAAHLEAMNAMRALMQSGDGMASWMEERRRAFEARPDVE